MVFPIVHENIDYTTDKFSIERKEPLFYYIWNSVEEDITLDEIIGYVEVNNEVNAVRINVTESNSDYYRIPLSVVFYSDKVGVDVASVRDLVSNGYSESAQITGINSYVEEGYTWSLLTMRYFPFPTFILPVDGLDVSHAYTFAIHPDEVDNCMTQLDTGWRFNVEEDASRQKTAEFTMTCTVTLSSDPLLILRHYDIAITVENPCQSTELQAVAGPHTMEHLLGWYSGKSFLITNDETGAQTTESY